MFLPVFHTPTTYFETLPKQSSSSSSRSLFCIFTRSFQGDTHLFAWMDVGPKIFPFQCKETWKLLWQEGFFRNASIFEMTSGNNCRENYDSSCLPIMSFFLPAQQCHVEYVIFYYGGKFLDVVREHFISSKMQVIVGSCRLLWWVHTFSPLRKSTVSKILIVTLSDDNPIQCFFLQ